MKKISILILITLSFSLLIFNGHLYADDKQMEGNKPPISQTKVEKPNSLDFNEDTPIKEEIQEPLPEAIESQSEKKAIESFQELQMPAPALLTNEIIVTNFTDFKNAIQTSNNGYTTIYLGADIVMTSGVNIPGNKGNLIIDGTDPNTGNQYTLTELATSALSATINISANSMGPSTIILRNLDIQGKNYYGTVAVNGNLSITLLYDNVTYYGPQLTYNPLGKAIYRNSTITIPATVTGGSQCQEVAEVSKVDFEGSVTINHSPSSVTHPILNMSGTGSLITFKQNAEVRITTNTGLNNNGSIATSLLFEPHANLMATQTASSIPFFSGVGQTFEMQNGSSMVLNRTVADFGAAGINMDSASGKFILSGASLSIYSTGNVGSGIIMTLPKMTLTDSSIYIETQKNQISRSILGKAEASLLNSTITAKISGLESGLNTRKVLDWAGFNLTMNNSTINLDIKDSSNGGFFACAKASLINATINSTVRGSFTNTSSPDMLFSTVNLDNSKLIGTYQNNSSGLLETTAGGTLDLEAKNGSIIQSVVAGSSRSVLNIAGAFNLQTRSKLYLDISSPVGNTMYPLSVGGNLSLQNDTYTSILVRSGALDGVIRLKTNGTSFTVNDPKSFLVYAPTATKILNSASSAAFSLTTQQVNQWTTSNTPTTSGTLDHLPNKRFAKADETNYVIQGTNAAGNTGVTTVTSSNFVTGVDGLNPVGNLSFLSSNAKIMSMGKLVASVNPISQYATSVTGTSEINGNVRLSYKSNGTSLSANGGVNHLGNYTLTTSPIDLDTYTLAANWNYLYYYITKTTLPTGSLKFTYVPATMDFGTSKIPVKTKTINRSDALWNIQIQDNRTTTANWQLLVQVNTPLTPTDITKPTINNGFIFIDSGNQMHSLSSTPVGIQTNKGGNQNTTVNWAINQGVLLRINPGKVYSGTTYKGTLQWTLQDAP